MDQPTNIAQRIVQKRHELRLTQTELARISGIAQTTISSIETEKTLPHLLTLSKLEKHLGFKGGELVRQQIENNHRSRQRTIPKIIVPAVAEELKKQPIKQSKKHSNKEAKAHSLQEDFDKITSAIQKIKEELSRTNDYEEGFLIKYVDNRLPILAEVEAAYIKHILKISPTKDEAAIRLGISRKTLWRREQELGLGTLGQPKTLREFLSIKVEDERPLNT